MLVACIFVIGTNGENSTRPVVLWHGMGDSAHSFFSMQPLINHIEATLNTFVYSISLGDSALADIEHSFLGNVNDQIEQVAAKLAAQPELREGFNAVGLSQGGQFLRAYVERYNNPPVYNLITLGGQHQGVFGFPDCVGTNETVGFFCNMVRKALTLGAYEPYFQNRIVQAQYWHTPLREERYIKKNHFLPDINNDGSFNATYRQHMASLNSFAMVLFENDTMVVPRISEHFGYYAPGQDQEEVPLQETDLYKQDLLGLKTLDAQGKLLFMSTPGEHLQFTMQWFDENIIPLLNNTL